jgi:RNA polymerase sigma factor (sigma-70 family)
VELCAKLHADLAFVDISMPGLNGVEACRQITTQIPSCKVIILSMHADQRFILKALQAGASGYLVKDCASKELFDAVAAVLQSGTYLGSTIAKVVVDDYLARLEKRAPADAAAEQLSPREREVLQLLAEGGSTREIAERLGVSIKTIETHRSQIMNKLNLHSVAQLTKYAIREGYTTLES